MRFHQLIESRIEKFIFVYPYCGMLVVKAFGLMTERRALI
jgi:hypothetical protein